MIKKQYIGQDFSNEHLEKLISNVVKENSQDNQDFLIIELAKSYLYTSVKAKNEEETKFSLLQVEENDQKLLPVFTNEDEMEQVKSCEGYEIVLVDFKDLMEVILYQENEYAGYIINPGSSKVIIDKELMEYIIDIHRTHDGQVHINANDVLSMQEMEKKEYPQNIINVLNAYFKSEKSINAAYMTILTQNGNKSYLLVTDFTGDKEKIFKKISETVKPHLKDIPLDQLEYSTEFGKELTKDIKPFYKKKIFGIF